MKWKQVLKKNYHQLIFVFIAFLLMIMVSIISVNAITRQKLLNASDEVLHTVEANIKMNLQEPEATLVGATFTVQDMVANRGSTQDEVLQYLTGLTDWLLESDERVSGFNGIYGVVREEYMDGTRWVPPADYVPQERPWYMTIKESTDDIAMTEPYIDAQTQVGIISFSKEVKDLDGKAIGVLALDVMLTRLTEYVSSLQQSYGGYGILLDSDFVVIAHPVKEFAGISFGSLSDDYAEVVAQLKAGSDIPGKTIRDTDGTRMILFSRKLYNGWYVGTLTPADSYYRDMYRMEAILIALGGVLMLALSLILMRLAAAKMRSDEENQSKSSFLARMSHEIRTPMNAILGMVELILRKDLPNDVREEAVAIKQAGSNLLYIIGDILDFSKIESNRMEIVSARYQLMSLLSDVINIIRMRVDEKSVLFVVNIDCNLPCALTGDEVRLRQVLLNLLSNAVKYTHEGYVRLTVSGKEDGDGKAELSFEVADTGIGIKEENLDKLFGDFTQFDTHKNIGIEGTGLGLAIARNLCRLMGGDITVTSKYGEGSVFTATIPQKITSRTQLAVVNAPEDHNVLIFETRKIYADSIAASLENLGVSCLCVTDRDRYTEALVHGEFSYVFVAPFLYDAALGTATSSASDATLVILSEINEAISITGVRCVSMPVYCAPIANLLNGVPESDAYGENESRGVRFTAPDARILIVDDVEVNLKVAEGLLSPYKTQIDLSTGGRKAIELVRKNDYDIVFMDHMMPEMDGIEAVKKIRALGEARFKNLPIVALTANAVSGMREMFLENGFNDYLAKPIEMNKLNGIMHKWISLEKRMNADASEKRAPDSHEFAFRINGVDTRRGLMMTGGSDESYREVLALFCRDAVERLGILSEVPGKDKLSLFITQVHALKSASASIGASSLSEQAAFLENAGQNGNMNAIRSCLDAFRTELEALVQNIRAALAALSVRTNGSPAAADSIDAEVLKNLKKALQEDDVATIDSITDGLSEKSYDTETDDAISDLSDSILISDFDEAIRIIDTLLRGVDNG